MALSPPPSGHARDTRLRLIASNRLLSQAEAGMVWVNFYEKRLIELWRESSPSGRGDILAAVTAIQRVHPRLPGHV